LELFQLESFVILETSCEKDLLWLLRSKIKIRRLRFTNGSFWNNEMGRLLANITLSESYYLFARVDAVYLSWGYNEGVSMVVDLEAERQHIQKLVWFFDSCPNLKELSTNFVHSFPYLEFLTSIDQLKLSQMTAFSFRGVASSGVNMPTISHISTVCKRLTSVSFRFIQWSDELMIELLRKQGATLRKIEFIDCILSETLLEHMTEALSVDVEEISLSAKDLNRGLCNKFFCQLSVKFEKLRCLNIWSRCRPWKLKRWIDECGRRRLYLELVGAEDAQDGDEQEYLYDDSHREILAACTDNHYVTILDGYWNQPRNIVTTLVTCNPNLVAINLFECDVSSGECFSSLRELFQKSTTLKTIKIAMCSMGVVDGLEQLLISLSRSVTRLLIGRWYYSLHLHVLKRIVSTNPQLEMLWYNELTIFSDLSDDCIKTSLLAVGGANLRIVDNLLGMEFTEDEFFD
jgi:hypothetical protein